MSRPLPDAAARRRIVEELGTNFLVEAGAGSGKTTALVDRMLALVGSGVPVEEIVAVTFTRKAAGELQRKFREGLEKAARTSGTDTATIAALDRALRDLDRGFVGTIHAFCARLLRERPLAAGVDPGFAEADAIEEVRLRNEFWRRALDDLYAREVPILARLRSVGLTPRDLRPAFEELVEFSDVRVPHDAVAVPDPAPLQDRLETLLEEALRLMPPRPLEKGPDDLMSTVRQLRFRRRTDDWSKPADIFGALEIIRPSTCDLVQRRWAADAAGKAAAKSLSDCFKAFVTGPVAGPLAAWRAHRYDAILECLLPLIQDFEHQRRATARLTFQDLLLLAARLLRDRPDARRELAERYPRLLVDEFQDTDPLQAEVCLLLAGEPEDGRDWREVRLRPGALFVVGDPKQSIYRFRRADLEVYGQVRDRIVNCGGEVLPLTANFRSRRAIGRFVDAAFRGRFPATPTREQAAFASLEAQRVDAAGCGVFRYDVRPEGGRKELVGLDDARRVASWIARRVAKGGRRPGDFLIVPSRREALAFYARELERRDIPVAVTGAGLAVEPELRELLVLLEALTDPGNPVWTLAALEGLFFGLDKEQLWSYVRAGGQLSIDRQRIDGGTPVDEALVRLREWSNLCRAWPVDAALQRILAEIGLLPLAAGDEMAESRAGSLVHVLDVAAAVAREGSADLRSAIEAMQAVIESRDVEASLRPGRADAVRVMNLHKAKGLEAPVVILPYPQGEWQPPVGHHIERADAEALGWFEFRSRDGRVLGRPADWAAHATLEQVFQHAERDRLLYVATTRARDELVVAEWPEKPEKSPWGGLHTQLAELATPLELEVDEPAARRAPAVTEAVVAARVAEVAERRADAARQSYEVSPVTATAADDEQARTEVFAFHGGDGKGREWGTIVHRVIAAMGRGRSDAALRRYVRALLLEAGRARHAGGEPLELAELLSLIEAVRRSPAWTELTAAGETRWELTVARLEAREGEPPRLWTGTVDALGGGPRLWRLVDWKTDAAEGVEWALRGRRYRAQTEAYRELVERLTGGEVDASVERVR